MDEKDDNQPQTPPPPKPNAGKTPVERLYDKIPLTYKQVDIIVKVLVAILAVVLIVGIVRGNGMGG